jgi:hydrogenase-1 operon protein HyaE
VSHPLIERLTTDHGIPEVGLDEHETFIGQPGLTVLFFAGDPKRYKETTDVAVVLPELLKAFDGQLRAALVQKDAEIELQKHYGFRQWPTLVFLRDGGYLGAISRVRNWSEYLEEIDELSRAETRRPPGFSIPVVPA